MVLALGSNLGDRLRHLAAGVRAVGRGVEVEALSSVYESDPVGYEDQPAFLNAVVTGRTTLTPEGLLDLARAAEEAAGRRRTFRDAPRTLDVDIVLFGDRVVDRPELRIPHPRFRERSFVLAPLVEVAPDRVDPGTGRSVEEVWRERRAALPPVKIHAPPDALRDSR